MNQALFFVFVGFLGLIFFASGVRAHTLTIQTAGGWWAGLVISILLFAYSQPYFRSLPEKTVTATVSDCGTTRTYTEQETDWDSVFDESTQINWRYIFVGFIACLIALEILQSWQGIPNRVIAIICLVLSFCSLSTILYVYLIRQLGYVIFSVVSGIVVGIPFHIAFRATRERWKETPWLKWMSRNL